MHLHNSPAVALHMNSSATAALSYTRRDFDVIGESGEPARKEELPFTCDMSEFYQFLDRLQVRDFGAQSARSFVLDLPMKIMNCIWEMEFICVPHLICASSVWIWMLLISVVSVLSKVCKQAAACMDSDISIKTLLHKLHL